MNIYLSNGTVHVSGFWTIARITPRAMDLMSKTLQQIQPGYTGKLQIDCTEVIAIDTIGQGLLTTWLQCASLRGAEPVIVNIPTKLQLAFRRLGLSSHGRVNSKINAAYVKLAILSAHK